MERRLQLRRVLDDIPKELYDIVAEYLKLFPHEFEFVGNVGGLHHFISRHTIAESELLLSLKFTSMERQRTGFEWAQILVGTTRNHQENCLIICCHPGDLSCKFEFYCDQASLCHQLGENDKVWTHNLPQLESSFIHIVLSDLNFPVL